VPFHIGYIAAFNPTMADERPKKRRTNKITVCNSTEHFKNLADELRYQQLTAIELAGI
jgi:hypothetical protein